MIPLSSTSPPQLWNRFLFRLVVLAIVLGVITTFLVAIKPFRLFHKCEVWPGTAGSLLVPGTSSPSSPHLILRIRLLATALFVSRERVYLLMSHESPRVAFDIISLHVRHARFLHRMGTCRLMYVLGAGASVTA